MTTTRRTVLGSLAALGLAGRVPVAEADEPAARSARQALRGLVVGERIVGDWILLDAYPPVNGGMSLVIARGREGSPLRVDVVRRGTPAKAPVLTEDLELFTMDAGGGTAWIDDSLLIVLDALGARLQASLPGSGLLAHLLTHTQRVARFPRFMGRAARELAPDPR